MYDKRLLEKIRRGRMEFVVFVERGRYGISLKCCAEACLKQSQKEPRGANRSQEEAGGAKKSWLAGGRSTRGPDIDISQLRGHQRAPSLVRADPSPERKLPNLGLSWGHEVGYWAPPEGNHGAHKRPVMRCLQGCLGALLAHPILGSFWPVLGLS